MSPKLNEKSIAMHISLQRGHVSKLVYIETTKTFRAANYLGFVSTEIRYLGGSVKSHCNNFINGIPFV